VLNVWAKLRRGSKGLHKLNTTGYKKWRFRPISRFISARSSAVADRPRDTLCHRIFNFLAPVVSEKIGGPKFTLGGPVPFGRSYRKIFDIPQVLAYTYITKVLAS